MIVWPIKVGGGKGVSGAVTEAEAGPTGAEGGGGWANEAVGEGDAGLTMVEDVLVGLLLPSGGNCGCVCCWGLALLDEGGAYTLGGGFELPRHAGARLERKGK